MPKAPNEAQMETLLNTVGFIGAQTGFPAINLTVTDDGSTIQGKDADIMIVGGIPDKLKDDKQIDLLVQATESWVKTPMRQTPFPGIVPDESDRAAETQSTLTSSGAMAAVIGFQSPYNDQRSVIALLADSPRGYEMLNDAVNDSGKRATMFGSVAVIASPVSIACVLATSITLAICRGSNAYGMRWQTIRSAGGAGGNQRRAAGLGTVASAAYYQPSSS